MLSPPPAAVPRVLVVDDDPGVRKFVVALLESGGCAVTEAADGEEGLAHLLAAEFDAAVIDLLMPKLDGLGLLAAVRDRGLTVGAILLTGGGDVGQAVEGMKLGAFEYVAKPVDPRHLQWTVVRAAEATHSRRRERVLAKAAADWEVTFDACPDVLVVVDAADRVVRANRAAGDLAAASQDELQGRRLAEFFPAVAVAADTPKALDGGLEVFDAAHGRHLLVSVRPIPPAAASPGAVVIARDVSEVVRGKETQTRLLRQLFTAQEDERRRVARELHDGPGQILASLLVGLTIAADRVGAADHPDKLRELARMAAEAADETRRLAHGLRPSVLDDFGLEAALRRLTDDFRKTHGVRITLDTAAAPTDRLPPEVESVAYRIAQEALANVARHAAASAVTVRLEGGEGRLRLSVSDDGRGFDPPRHAADPPPGLGLSGMRERVLTVGGWVEVVSRPGGGTTVDVHMPTVGGGA